MICIVTHRRSGMGLAARMSLILLTVQVGAAA
jgi:hypothetical protein